MSGVMLDDIQNFDYLANTSVTFILDLFTSDLVF